MVDRDDIAKYRTLMKEFDAYEKALSFCKWYLDETFKTISKDEPSKDGFKKYWTFWGEDLYIAPTSDENFSSWDYIQEKINKHYKKTKI